MIPRITANLESNGRNHGTSYTDAERALALDVSKVILSATGHADFSGEFEDDHEVVQTLMETLQEKEHTDVPSLCRAVYRKIEKKRLTDDSTVKDFPKMSEGIRSTRDFTSMNLLFRHAFEKSGMTDIDKSFPAYYKAKGKKKA